MAHTAMGDMYVEQLKEFAGGKITAADGMLEQALKDLNSGKITQDAFNQIQANVNSIKDFYSSGITVTGYGSIGYTVNPAGN